jgi:nucleoside-diphosphate-sugar epimerase
VQRPTTLYGVTKVVGELLCDDYARRCGLDARGLRLPCLISHELPLGGGTTDYAVEIFHHAIRHRHYTCRLAPDTRLDMMYMPDTIDAIIRLMEADPARLRHRNAFNVTAMNFTPDRLAREIREHIPEFAIDYEVDPVRQAIADSWPRSIDDSAARAEWDWSPAYDLESMTRDMLEKLVKIGAKVVRHGRYVTFQLAEVAVPRKLFRKILSLIDDLRRRPVPVGSGAGENREPLLPAPVEGR